MTTFSVNGTQVVASADAQTPLLDTLRNELGLKAVRMGCGLGQCGACHVVVNGRSIASCDTPLWSVANQEVITLEAAQHNVDHALRPILQTLQKAFEAEQAAQCGFCTSGLLMTAAVLLQDTPLPEVAQIHAALDRHLCRCGAHLRIVRAIQNAAQVLQAGAP